MSQNQHAPAAAADDEIEAPPGMMRMGIIVALYGFFAIAPYMLLTNKDFERELGLPLQGDVSALQWSCVAFAALALLGNWRALAMPGAYLRQMKRDAGEYVLVSFWAAMFGAAIIAGWSPLLSFFIAVIALKVYVRKAYPAAVQLDPSRYWTMATACLAFVFLGLLIIDFAVHVKDSMIGILMNKNWFVDHTEKLTRACFAANGIDNGTSACIKLVDNWWLAVGIKYQIVKSWGAFVVTAPVLFVGFLFTLMSNALDTAQAINAAIARAEQNSIDKVINETGLQKNRQTVDMIKSELQSMTSEVERLYCAKHGIEIELLRAAGTEGAVVFNYVHGAVFVLTLGLPFVMLQKSGRLPAMSNAYFYKAKPAPNNIVRGTVRAIAH